jgi:hypothetical protein
MKRLRAGTGTLLFLVACLGPDPNLTDSGKGLPVLSVDFPATVAAGSTNTATLTVENPGPGDMGSVVVAFAAVGVAAASGPLPVELVPIAADRDNPAVRTVRPRPESVSPDGVVYVFEGLQVGETMPIEFAIVAPDEQGPAANSVSVYDGGETNRIRGLRLETVVTG